MLNERLLQDFTASVRQKGAIYAAQGLVHGLLIQGDTLTAEVRGGERYSVCIERVRESKKTWNIFVSCTCPHASDQGCLCKHIWATLVHANGQVLQAWGEPPREVWIELEENEDAWGDLEEDDPPPARNPSPTRTVQGPQTPKPAARKPPAWRRTLEECRSPFWGDRYQQPKPGAPITWPLWYVIDEADSRLHKVFYIEVSRQPDRRRSENSKLVRVPISAPDIERIENEQDRTICAILVGAARPGREWDPYRFQSRSTARSAVWQLDPAMLGSLAPMIAATGRFQWRPSGSHQTQPISWNPEPHALALELRPLALDESRAELRPTLRRASQPDSFDLSAACAACAGQPGGVLVAGTLSPLHATDGLLSWAGQIAQRRPTIDRSEVPDLLDQLDKQQIPLPLTWPDNWGPRRHAASTPTPRLVLTTPKNRHASPAPALLPADLHFLYGQTEVTSASPSYLLETSPDGMTTLVQRDQRAERHARDDFFDNGGKSDPYNGMLNVPAKRLPDLAAALLAQGWEIVRDARPLRQAGAFKIHIESGIDWFDLRGGVDFGSGQAPISHILEALRKGERLVKLGDGSNGLLPEDWLARHGRWLGLGAAHDGHVRFSRAQLSIIDALVADMPDATCDAQLAAARKKLQGFAGIHPRTEPQGFKGALRPYQREGLAWLWFLADLGLGGCLADDMGLGKTVQLLAHILDRRGQAPWLVVAPKSLVSNWAAEAARFAPSLRVLSHTGPERATSPDALAQPDLLLTTYATMRSDIELLRQVEFDCVVLDEAQAIKNADSQGAKAARLLLARRRLALTGTPVENSLDDLWSIFEFLNPGMLGRSESFRSAVRGDPEALAQLRRALRPFMLRRTKASVAPELPPRTEQTVRCELAVRQRALYDDLRAHYRRQLLGRIDKEGMNKSRMHVLEALLRLRQAACHPALIETKPTAKEAGSAKVELLADMLEELASENHRSLVFSQFTSLLALVRQELDKRHIAFQQLDGSTPAKERTRLIANFQSADSACRVFLISLKAGGVGLNLTAAGYVFLLDPWWNPAVEAQAIDRAHRIGQDKSVMAYRLVAADTVEERILELQDRKRELAAAIISENDGPLSTMTREDLEWLLT